MTFYSIGEAARMLGVKQHRLAYAHTNGGDLAEPQRIFGKRAYTQDDLERAAQYFGVELSEQEGGDDERP